MNETPDFFSELTGWRKFAVRDHSRVLVSANYPQPWAGVDPGPAICTIDTGTMYSFGPVPVHPVNEPCPCLTCSCGYYAYKSRDDAEQHHQGRVLARVQLWGRLVEHERGYRAERIRIAELFVLRDYPEVGRAGLAARYGVPIHVEEKAVWISESLSESSLLSPSLIQSWNSSAYQIVSYQSTLPSPSPSQRTAKQKRQDDAKAYRSYLKKITKAEW
jgi:hypothetical protein